jgi:hypothetical protein
MQPAPPEQVVLDRFGLTGNALESVLGTALERRADWADCYFEIASVQTASLEEGACWRAHAAVTRTPTR